MKPVTIALAQMDLQIGNPARNLETARARIDQARERGADLVVLPELWGSGADPDHAAGQASSLDAGLFAEIGRAAREFHVAVAGSLLEADGPRLYNTATLVDAQGNRAGVYRKIHLISLMDEDKYLTGGEEAPLLELFGPCALAVCYDLRFPELWRHYALSGAYLVLLPSEWPIQRIAHWRALLPARAIENQIFIAATNRVGVSNGETFGGHSMIVSPWGDILVEGDENEALLVAQIDLELVDQVREQLPIWKARRPQVYAGWSSR